VIAFVCLCLIDYESTKILLIQTFLLKIILVLNLIGGLGQAKNRPSYSQIYADLMKISVKKHPMRNSSGAIGACC